MSTEEKKAEVNDCLFCNGTDTKKDCTCEKWCAVSGCDAEPLNDAEEFPDEPGDEELEGDDDEL